MNTTRNRLALLGLLAAVVALAACSKTEANPNQPFSDAMRQSAPAPTAAEMAEVNPEFATAENPTTQQVGNIEFSEDSKFENGDEEVITTAAPALDENGYSNDTKFESGDVEVDTAPTAKKAGAPLPADGADYTADLGTMTTAIQTGNPGRYFGLPQAFTATGYPIFPAQCTFINGKSTCVTAQGKLVTEDYLAGKTTVVRNIDVLDQASHTCGAQICVDNNANVIGHVSKQMIAWRKTNCTWTPDGTSVCRL